MRITLALDDELLAKVQAFTGLIEREGARRLARLGGTEPTLASAARGRFARKFKEHGI